MRGDESFKALKGNRIICTFCRFESLFPLVFLFNFKKATYLCCGGHCFQCGSNLSKAKFFSYIPHIDPMFTSVSSLMWIAA